MPITASNNTRAHAPDRHVICHCLRAECGGYLLRSAQPLLDAIGRGFGINQASVGLVITVTQAGYALGLLFIVPLADLG